MCKAEGSTETHLPFLYITALFPLFLYVKHRWEEAGDSLVKAADMEITIGRKLEAASYFYDAGKYYRRWNSEAAIEAERKVGIE